MFLCNTKQEAKSGAALSEPVINAQLSSYIKTDFIADTLYASEDKDYFVIGNAKTKKISSISIKYKPNVLFTDFQVKPVSPKPKIKIDWSSYKDAKHFKTRISEACSKENINFAGHYCFVSWGCGSECFVSVIVDALTGKIYDGVGATSGFDFKPDSRMLVVNPPDTTGFYSDCSYCKPIIYIWDEKSKGFIER
jgi:hypothetical protein